MVPLKFYQYKIGLSTRKNLLIYSHLNLEKGATL